jgi:homoserine dehydrogenase
MTLDLVLIGYGNVARRFVTLLAEQRSALARDLDLRVRVVGIATRRHGCVYGSSYVVSGFSRTLTAAGPTTVRLKADTTYDLQPWPFSATALTKSRVAARQGRLVVIETTTLDIARGEPAIRHIRSALAWRRTCRDRETRARPRLPTARSQAQPRAPTDGGSLKAR